MCVQTIGAYAGTSFQILLGGGNRPPQAIEFQDVFFIEFLNAWKRADHTTPPPDMFSQVWMVLYFAWIYPI